MDINLSNQKYSILAAKSAGKEEAGWLPVWVHLLDTVGIMENLVDKWISPAFDEKISIKIPNWKNVAKFVAITHDIGKFTPVFQSKISSALSGHLERLESYGINIPNQSELLDANQSPHAVAGEAILLHFDCSDSVAAVVGAHHGKPQGIADDIREQMLYYEENFYGTDENAELWEEIWQSWLKFSLAYCEYNKIEDLPQLDARTQVILSGLLIMADWIASNPNYFPLLDIENKGEKLLYPNRVEWGYNELSLPTPWECEYTNNDIFKRRFGFEANTVQKCMLDAVSNAKTAGIYILEAQMGVGKTEAALAAAEIFSCKNAYSGLFFGLPTQATANGIFPRLANWANKQSDSVAYAIRLAHGMSELNEDYQTIFHGKANQSSDGGLIVHSWFEGRKQALLANFVVGTIDQLLMLALKQKHVMMRHLGVAGKVVIIDECHAYDAYMNRYLDRALNWLSGYGVPVILLSATLPPKRRTELIEAYAGKDITFSDELKHNIGYPLLTWSDGQRVCQKIINTDKLEISVTIQKTTEKNLISILEKPVKSEGCIGIIVNSVKKAQNIVKQIEKIYNECDIILVHARLTMEDRLRVEKELLKRVGKTSTPQNRKRLIVVGTQILEQSLDIDFDYLITEICPMDLLLQRIGRLHRHERKRPEGLEKPICTVIDEIDDKTIYSKWLLYQTQRLLPQTVCLPHDISKLVQKTYEDLSDDMLSDEKNCVLWEEYKRQLKNKKQKAEQNCIPKPENFDDTIHGLLESNIGDSEFVAQASVRDGQPSITVIALVKKDDQTISFLPWVNDGYEIINNHAPSQQECCKLLRQRLSLPIIYSGVLQSQAINELEFRQRKIIPEWQNAQLLNGELFLFFDESCQTELCGYKLSYDKKYGLEYERVK